MMELIRGRTLRHEIPADVSGFESFVGEQGFAAEGDPEGIAGDSC